MHKTNIFDTIKNALNILKPIVDTKPKYYERPFNKGRHLIVDARNVPMDTLINSKKVMKALIESIEIAGANVLTTTRHEFGLNSPPGYAMTVTLDESHCAIHTYAENGLLALDFFTCSTTDPEIVFKNFIQIIDIGNDYTMDVINRFKH